MHSFSPFDPFRGFVPSSGGGGTPALLTGTPYGSRDYSDDPSLGPENLFDGNDSNFSIQVPPVSGIEAYGYAGLDFGSGKTITEVRIWPVNWNVERLDGLKWYGANASNHSDKVLLATIGTAADSPNTLTVTDAGTYRWVFALVQADANLDALKMEIYGY